MKRVELYARVRHALTHPGHGPLRVAHELMLQGVQVSSGGVRGVWSRHDLLIVSHSDAISV